MTQIAEAALFAFLIGALVGLLSSVIPYSCELVALRSLRPAVFGVMDGLVSNTALVAGVAAMASAWRASTGSPASPGGAVATRCVASCRAGAAASKAITSTPGDGRTRSGVRLVASTRQPRAATRAQMAAPV